jgi:hypothetical protein
MHAFDLSVHEKVCAVVGGPGFLHVEACAVRRVAFTVRPAFTARQLASSSRALCLPGCVSTRVCVSSVVVLTHILVLSHGCSVGVTGADSVCFWIH